MPGARWEGPPGEWELGGAESTLWTGMRGGGLRPTKPELPPFSLRQVCGVVFFSSRAAEQLLATHVIPPLNACTYMGLDSGALALQVGKPFLGQVGQKEPPLVWVLMGAGVHLGRQRNSQGKSPLPLPGGSQSVFQGKIPSCGGGRGGGVADREPGQPPMGTVFPQADRRASWQLLFPG